MRDAVDLARLREFSDGSEEGFLTLARLFLAEVEETAVALGRAVAGGEMPELEALSHRVAGTAGACGAPALAAALSHLESAAHERSIDGAAALWPGVEQELAAVRRFLRGAVTSIGGSS